MSKYLSREQASLALLCATLMAFVLYQAMMANPTYTIPVVPLPHAWPKAATAVPFLPPSNASFTEIDTRLVFNPARTQIRPADAPGKDPNAPPPAPTSQLVGIIIDNKTRIAILAGSATTPSLTVGVGGSVEGWDVSEIEPDKVVLKNGAYVTELRENMHSTPAASANSNPANPAGAPAGERAIGSNPQVGR